MRSFTREQQHNVGGFNFMANQLPYHNMGEVPAGCPSCPPGVDPQVWVDIFRRHGLAGCRQLCNLGGGTPGLGFGGYDAPPQLQLPKDARGCEQGWIQRKQPLAMNASAVGAGATATITVTPRRVVRAYQWVYSGPALTFTVLSIQVDGVEYVGNTNGFAADAYAAAVTDHSFDIGEFSSTTPLIAQVTNTTGAAATFTSTWLVAASRG